MRSLFKLVKKFQALYKNIKINHTPRIVYRLAGIENSKDESHLVVIQIIGKRLSFKAKPEELLADEKIIENFSQKDIRTLTYLSHLNINQPSYKVIATHHAKKSNKMIFALNKKGEKNPVIKTADQISIDKEILSSLNQTDAHLIGYITAVEQTLQESQEKEKLKLAKLNDAEEKVALNPSNILFFPKNKKQL